jgi:hypothetical protein
VLRDSILPSLLFNLFLSALLYVPLRQYAERMVPESQPEEG